MVKIHNNGEEGGDPSKESFNDKWVLDPPTASEVWDLMDDSKDINLSEDIPFIYDITIMFFSDRSESDSINNWYMTRIPGEDYGPYNWYKIPTKFSDDYGNLGDLRLGTINKDIPRIQITFQQYTVQGGMITADISNNKNGDLSGMVRIPVEGSQLQRAKSVMDRTSIFEFFEIQSRAFRGQFQSEEVNEDEFYHPHFRIADLPKSDYTSENFLEGFRKLVKLTEESAERFRGV